MLSSSLAQVTSQPLVPAWFIVPVSIIGLLVLAAHVLLLWKSPDVPPLRRRIRTATTLLMMLTIPILAYAFAFAHPGNARAFVLSWVLSASMLLVVLALAAVDLLATAHWARRERAEFRKRLRDARAAGGLNNQDPHDTPHDAPAP